LSVTPSSCLFLLPGCHDERWFAQTIHPAPLYSALLQAQKEWSQLVWNEISETVRQNLSFFFSLRYLSCNEKLTNSFLLLLKRRTATELLSDTASVLQYNPSFPREISFCHHGEMIIPLGFCPCKVCHLWVIWSFFPQFLWYVWHLYFI
jgi:hypothetical protein